MRVWLAFAVPALEQLPSSQIKLVATAGSVGGCCGTGTIDTIITGVSAW